MNQTEKQALPGISIPSLAELRAHPDGDLMDLHDQIAFLSRLSPSYILDELARREHYRQTRALQQYARTTAILAGIIAGFTAFMLFAVLVALMTVRSA